jgi:hypothetical protein
MRTFFIFSALFLAGTALFAQSAASDFETKANDDGSVTITKYAGWDTEVIIPAKIGGKPVTVIGSEAFKGADLTKVTIPAGIISIESSAFANNKLTGVVIPEGVMDIEGYAFRGNPLESVTLPGSITYLSNKYEPFVSEPPATFILGANIGISSGSGTSALGYAVFYNYIANGRKAGTYTQDMLCEEVGNDWDSGEEIEYNYVKTQYGVVLEKYHGRANRVKVPETMDGMAVKALAGGIGKGGLYSNPLLNLMIPEGITCIGDAVFSGNSLTSVTIPASVTYIGSAAFSSNQLTSVTIPANVTYIGGEAFKSNQLTSVTIPNGVTIIGYDAFAGNKLTSVTIPASVTHLGRDAFDGVETIVIGANVAIKNVKSAQYDSFETFYYKNGRKAGRYTRVRKGYFNLEWSYSAK